MIGMQLLFMLCTHYINTFNSEKIKQECVFHVLSKSEIHLAVILGVFIRPIDKMAGQMAYKSNPHD